MNRISRAFAASLTGLGLLLTVMAVGAVTAGAATPHDVAPAGFDRVASVDFPDPGFAKFGAYYYLYRTGAGFSYSRSTHPGYGFSAPALSMYPPGDAHDYVVPPWSGTASVGANHPWAPHVFRYADRAGTFHYVMYFSAYSAIWQRDCIGIATALSPSGPFVPQSRATYCDPRAHYGAIDPTSHRTPGGARYLVFKVSHYNTSDWSIRAIRMNATGTARSAIEPRVKVLIAANSMMEAPDVLLHGGTVWLFTARGDWANCSYSTDVWRASSLWSGRFTRVKTIMSTASTNLCGPGGAEVIQDSQTTRIAFHAWNDPTAKIRYAYTAILRWDSHGNPYLYRA